MHSGSSFISSEGTYDQIIFLFHFYIILSRINLLVYIIIILITILIWVIYIHY